MPERARGDGNKWRWFSTLTSTLTVVVDQPTATYKMLHNFRLLFLRNTSPSQYFCEQCHFHHAVAFSFSTWGTSYSPGPP